METRTKTRKEKAEIISAACLFFGVLIFGIASSFVYHFDTKTELNKKEEIVSLVQTKSVEKTTKINYSFVLKKNEKNGKITVLNDENKKYKVIVKDSGKSYMKEYYVYHKYLVDGSYDIEKVYVFEVNKKDFKKNEL